MTLETLKDTWVDQIPQRLHLWERHRFTVRVNPSWEGFAIGSGDRAWLFMVGHLIKGRRLWSRLRWRT